MALDQAYFDAIHIEVVKKKYYNANKVEAVFEDIRRQAELLTQENELMHRQLASLRGQKDEIGDTLLSAKTIAQQIISDAQSQAEKLLTEARRVSREMTAEAERDSREAREEAAALRRALPRRLEELEHTLRLQMLGLTDEVCSTVKGFSALPQEAEDEAAPAAEAAAEAETAPDAEAAPEDEAAAEADLAAELRERVGAIAREIAEIGAGE